MNIDPYALFSTPAGAPLVPTFPFEFRNVEIMTVLYRTDLERVTALLPPPLEAVNDTVIVHLYKMNDTDWFGAYNESAIQVCAVLPSTGEQGAYSPYLFLDHDGAIAAGREVYGQPKKYGEPSIEVRSDLLVGRIRRNGIDVLTVTLPYKTRKVTQQEMLARVDFVTNFNLKVIPSIEGAAAIRQLTARELTKLTVYECWAGPATVELRPSAQAPVHLLPVREMYEGFFWRCDFTLDYGRVLYNFLDQPEPQP